MVSVYMDELLWMTLADNKVNFKPRLTCTPKAGQLNQILI